MNQETKIKTIKVSPQRQMTIPTEFYNTLGIGDEVTVQIVEGNLLIIPIHKLPEDYAETTLEQLIAEGYSGQELLDKFKEAKQKAAAGVELTAGNDF